MGTEHLGVPTQLSAAEIAERAIDFIEEQGWPLLPWQAETLRAMLTYPVGTRFVVNTPPQRPHPGMVKVLRDGKWAWENPPRKGFQSDHIVMDEVDGIDV